MREVVRSDKYNLRKYGNRNSQTSVIHSGDCTDFCFAICRFSQVVFVTSNNSTHNLLFFFQKVLVLIWCIFLILAQYSLSFALVCASSLGPLRGRNYLCLWLWQHGLWCFTSGCRVQSPPPPNTPLKLVEVCSMMGEGIRPSSFYNPTLSGPRISRVQICRFSLSAAADGERRTSPFNGDAQSWNDIERSLSRAVVPQSLPVSTTTFPTVLSLYIAQGHLRKNIRYPSCFQRQNCCHLKRKNTSTWPVLLAWSMPTQCCWVIHGRLTRERKTSTSPSSFINFSILRQVSCLYMLAWISLLRTVRFLPCQTLALTD